MKTINISRNHFLANVKSLGILLLTKSNFVMAQSQESPVPLDPALVQEFVRLGQFDLDNVKRQLQVMKCY